MRHLSRLVVSALLLSLLIGMTACGGDDSSKTVSAGDPSGIKVDIPALPQYTFSSNTVRVLTHDASLAESDIIKTVKELYGLEVKVDIVAAAERVTKLINQVMADEAPDVFQYYWAPTLMKNKYVQPIDAYIDFDSDFWRDKRTISDQLEWEDGKHYITSPSDGTYHFLYFNRSIFEEEDEKTPYELYKEGSWDWNVMEELARKMTHDTNKDGEPEQYGLGMSTPETLLYTTGKHVVTLENGKVINTVKSPEIARCFRFVNNMLDEGIVDTNSQEDFLAGKVAMCFGHLYNRLTFKDLSAAGALGIAPIPKDPEADKYYIGVDAEGWQLPYKASNPEGYGAFLSAMRYEWFLEEKDPARKEEAYQLAVKAYNWNETLQKEFEGSQIENKVFGVWQGLGIGDYWGDVFSRPFAGEPWETIAEEISPLIDKKLEDAYA